MERLPLCQYLLWLLIRVSSVSLRARESENKWVWVGRSVTGVWVSSLWKTVANSGKTRFQKRVNLTLYFLCLFSFLLSFSILFWNFILRGTVPFTSILLENSFFLSIGKNANEREEERVFFSGKASFSAACHSHFQQSHLNIFFQQWKRNFFFLLSCSLLQECSNDKWCGAKRLSSFSLSPSLSL